MTDRQAGHPNRPGPVITDETWSPGDLNDKGQVVGGEVEGGIAYLWSLKDGMVRLVDDGVRAAVRVNDRGQVLGKTGPLDPEYPLRRHCVIRETDGSLTYVALFDLALTWPWLGDFNNRGQVVYALYHWTTSKVISYLWDPKGGTIEYEGIYLAAINDHGLMAGNNSVPRPVLFDGEQVVELPTPVGLFGFGTVLDINNHGVAVGYVDGPGGEHAVVWTPSK